MEKKTVDVIIPAYRPGEGWKQMLRGLEGQTWPVHRLIVMNTGKENWKAAYEKTTISMEVHHLTREEFDHGKTRDQAARMVTFILASFSFTGKICIHRFKGIGDLSPSNLIHLQGSRSIMRKVTFIPCTVSVSESRSNVIS